MARRSTMVVRCIAVAALALAGCTFDPPPQPRSADGCVIGGCSGELCADQSLVSPCIWRDAYACYRQASCERQSDGACGWTPTRELTACLAEHGGTASQP